MSSLESVRCFCDRGPARLREIHRHGRCSSNFWRDEAGTATAEFVIWIPIFVVALILCADASFIFTTNASMWDVARDLARRVAQNQMPPEMVDTFARQNLFNGTRNYTIDVDQTVQDVTVTISLPFRSADMLGWIGSAWGGTMAARVAMLREPV